MLSVEQPLFPKDVLGESGPIIPSVFHTPQQEIVEKYVSSVLSLYGQLSKFSNLDPAPEVNAVFGKLVGLCAETPNETIAEKILTDPRVVKITPHLRQLCSEGECRLEAHWASRIIIFESEKDVNTALLNFPYYENYIDLTRMELYSILSMLPTSPRSFAFIGSGPLPLTSLCLADILSKTPNPQTAPPVRIHNIDRDSRAITLSKTLCTKLGARATPLTFQCTEAMEEQNNQKDDLAGFDVVYLAALVGATKCQKAEIVADVAARMRVGALLVLRSAHSLRSLLYPVIDPATDLQRSVLEPLLTVHPYNHIVNSVVIARVTGGGDRV